MSDSILLRKDVKYLTTPNWSVLPLVENIVSERSLSIKSCLDIGSGTRPKIEWFSETYGQSSSFCALEADKKLRQKLCSKGIYSVASFDDISKKSYDLTLMLEVLEHIKPDESLDFLKKISEKTNILFAMTVPNFEYWDENLKPLEKYRLIRWIPDHFPMYEPDSLNIHRHRQRMTPDILFDYLSLAFPSPTWKVLIFRAWPWEIIDRSVKDKKQKFYFKIFGVALRV